MLLIPKQDLYKWTERSSIFITVQDLGNFSNKSLAVVLPHRLATATLVDIVKPVDQVEESECDWEDNTGPLVYGIDIREVGDLDFELRGPPPQAALLVAYWPVNGWPSIEVTTGHGLAVLYAGTVIREHGSPRVVKSAHHICSTHLTG